MAHTLNRTATLVFVTALISLVIANGALFAQIPPEEREALIALYEATDGDNWALYWRSRWLGPPGTEGTWRGVTVENGHVVSIVLPGNTRLRGFLPPEIGNLAHLKVLDLGALFSLSGAVANRIGSLPPEIGQLSFLEKLDLSFCGLENLPDTVGDLNNLRVLNLRGNELSLLTPRVGGLQKLNKLDLQGNLLTTVPAEIGTLSSLEELLLGSNPITTLPATIGSLNTLKWLYLRGCPFVRFPAEIGSLTGLERLDMGSSKLTELTSAIGGLSNLTSLSVSYSNIETLPAEIGNLTNLKVLELDRNRLVALPPEIGNLVNLVELEVESNQLQQLPPEMGGLENLERLNLDDNRLTSLPSGLHGMKRLSSIEIRHNRLSSIPGALGQLPALQMIDASNNEIRSITPELAAAPELTILYLGGNQLEVLPSFIGQIAKLERLYASSSQIHTIEEGALTSPNLTRIYLADNDLKEVPLEVTRIKSLQHLNLSHNRFEGPLPAELSNLRQILSLNLSSNQLSGDVPKEFALLFEKPEYTSVDLQWNALTVRDEALKKELGDISVTQTIPPEDLEVAEISGTAVELTWAPIPFSEGPGGYEVLVSTQPGGPFQSFGRTSDKHASSITVSNLETDTTYYFRVRTISEPNENNKNEVISETGAEVSATTLPFTYFYYPLIMAGSESYTGFAASNLSGSDTELVFEGYGPDGLPFEAAFNPAGFALEDGTQLARLGGEIFGTDQIPAGSWLELKSGKATLGSFFQIGSQSALDGGVPLTAPPLKRFYFTRAIGAQDLFANVPVRILISLINPTDEGIEVELTLVSNQREFLVGTKTETALRTLPPRGSLLESVDELFGDHGFPSGFIRIDVTEGEGAFGFSLLEIDGGKTLVGLNPVDETTALELFSAQIASAPDIFTNLKLINTTGAERQVQLTLLSEEGEPIADPKTLSFSSINRFLERNIGDLFDLPPGLSIGSLRVEADGPGVIGDVLFGAPSTLDYAAAALLQAETFQEAVFSHVARSSEIFTGLALFNPTAETADITIEEFSAAGNLVGSAVIELPAGQRRAAVLSELMPDAPGNIGGFLTIRSNQPLVAQQLFGGHALHFLSSVPPTIFR